MIYAYLDIHTHMCVTYRYINIRTTIHTYIYILFFCAWSGEETIFSKQNCLLSLSQHWLLCTSLWLPTHDDHAWSWPKTIENHHLFLRPNYAWWTPRSFHTRAAQEEWPNGSSLSWSIWSCWVYAVYAGRFHAQENTSVFLSRWVSSKEVIACDS